jgi:hypothetical protein
MPFYTRVPSSITPVHCITQTEEPKSGEEILQTIEPKGIADESMRRTVEILLNLIEQLQAEVKELRAENQQLKDENNRLKGEQGTILLG